MCLQSSPKSHNQSLTLRGSKCNENIDFFFFSNKKRICFPEEEKPKNYIFYSSKLKAFFRKDDNVHSEKPQLPDTKAVNRKPQEFLLCFFPVSSI